jgi:hypothetical protein
MKTLGISDPACRGTIPRPLGFIQNLFPSILFATKIMYPTEYNMKQWIIGKRRPIFEKQNECFQKAVKVSSLKSMQN